MNEQAPKQNREDLIQKNIRLAIEFLKENTEDIKIKLPEGDWDFATMQNESAKKLEEVIDENVGHSGSSFVFALKEVITGAEKNGYIVNEEKRGGDTIVTIKKV